MVELKTAGALFIGAAAAGLASAGVAVEPASLPVYDATQVAFGQYVVVKRVGIDDWRSAFRIKGHPDLAAATQAVLNEAAHAGADAVVNLTCFDRTDAIFNPSGYFCYGNAVRLKK
jgi:hypothetical protein